MNTVFENDELIIIAGDDAHVTFKGVAEISDNYRAHAEIAVQQWLDTHPEGYENAIANFSRVYDNYVLVTIIYL